MIVDNNIADLIGVLECKIGSQTYNPNSYNGWTGVEGCSYRYPVNYCKSKADLENRKTTKTRRCIEHLEPECICTMKYAFGSNHLYVGDGLIKVLEYLEKVYNIDFNELEEKRIKKKKSILAKKEEKLNAGEIVKIQSGILKVGLDIPVGRFKMINMKENSKYLSADIYNADGDIIDNLFTDSTQVDILLKEGCYIKLNQAYSLKKNI